MQGRYTWRLLHVLRDCNKAVNFTLSCENELVSIEKGPGVLMQCNSFERLCNA